MTRPATLHTQAKRAVTALRKAGVVVTGVVFPPEGGFRVLTAEPGAASSSAQGEAPAGRNAWDEVLPKAPSVQ